MSESQPLTHKTPTNQRTTCSSAALSRPASACSKRGSYRHYLPQLHADRSPELNRLASVGHRRRSDGGRDVLEECRAVCEASAAIASTAPRTTVPTLPSLQPGASLAIGSPGGMMRQMNETGSDLANRTRAAHAPGAVRNGACSDPDGDSIAT